MFEMLSLPFMQRALIAGAILAVLLAALGVFATLRKMAFFGDGIAHSSLAGIAIAVIGGFAPLPVALVWAVVVALLIWRLEKSSRLPSDTVIGIFFTASMALGVVLMSFTRGYQPELLSFLFGSILSVKPSDILVIAVASLAVAAWLIPSFNKLAYICLAEDNATIAGLNVRFHTAAFYVALAAATVLGVKIVGIVLVSALIILPPAAARLMTRSLHGYLAASLVLAEAIMISGVVLSYRYDLPTGATVVLVGTAVFFLALLAGMFGRTRSA